MLWLVIGASLLGYLVLAASLAVVLGRAIRIGDERDPGVYPREPSVRTPAAAGTPPAPARRSGSARIA